MTRLAFELPNTWLWGAPLAIAALGFFYRSLAVRGFPRRRILTLVGLRGMTGLLLLLLIARPSWVALKEQETRQRQVVVLLDRSASMSLRDGGDSRYRRAVDFLGEQLMPVMKSRELRSAAVLFAEQARDANGAEIRGAKPDGQQTDLAAAITHSVSSRHPPPLAVVALTDGAATQNQQNRPAISALVENGVPFIGVGFGSETGSDLLSLEKIDAPANVPTDQQFAVAVHLRATGQGALPPFDLVLTRNGQFVQQRRIEAVTTPRHWQESFDRIESEQNLVNYAVQMLPPSDPSLVIPNRDLSTSVRVTDEKDLRVLFVQGGLTWDYKFVRLAVASDPSIQLSALSRTANRSSFFENVQGDAELVGGFPTTLQQLARYRVVVLSNLSPSDLTDEQQQLLDRFCGEFAGGLLMMGGPSTINANWRGTRLEQLMPVLVAPAGQLATLGRFRVRLTENAARHPVLQIADDGQTAAAWGSLPHFTGYAPVRRVKPGAEVWMEAASDGGNRSPLMVVQRYGRGLSAAICLQNFWRWRLAKDADPAQFDRFWRQLLRFLSEGSRDALWLSIPNQQLEPGRDLRLEVELRPDSQRRIQASASFSLHVLDQRQQLVSRQSVRLRAGQTTELTFQVADPGLYQLNLVDNNNIVQVSRSVEIRKMSSEFIKSSRDIENLRQWAQLSGGMAVKAEDCQNARQLVDRMTMSLEQIHRNRPRSTPAAINGWVLILVLAGVCAEWSLRKRWGLV